MGLPEVDASAVSVAADVEPLRGNQVGLGDDLSTILVQDALVSHGYQTPTDGRYSRATTRAYAAFQRSLGDRGIDANGIPDPATLARLGEDLFTVTNPVLIGDRDARYDGKRVNARTAAMLAAADAKLSWTLHLEQGSYCLLTKIKCDPSSSGTHDGGGAVDISTHHLSSVQKWRTVQALRQVGFAAWLRTPAQCSCWAEHIHAIAIGDTDLWQSGGQYANRDQVGDYFIGLDGLAVHHRDNTPRQYQVPFTTWERYERRHGGH